jgi:hypothetical protein
VAYSVPNKTKLRPLIVPWSTLCRADCVRDDSVLASTRGPVRTTTQFLREWPEPCGSEQASGIIMTAWAGGAVEQPTITGRTRLAPDSIQPLFACEDCTFLDQCIAPASRKKIVGTTASNGSLCVGDAVRKSPKHPATAHFVCAVHESASDTVAQERPRWHNRVLSERRICNAAATRRDTRLRLQSDGR